MIGGRRIVPAFMLCGAQTVAIDFADAEILDIVDRQMIRVVTEEGAEEVGTEVCFKGDHE